MLALLLVALAADPAPAAERATLTGVVKDDQGRPRVGATVFIRTAAPRVGVGVL